MNGLKTVLVDQLNAAGQKTSAPSRKITAVGISGAITAAICAVLAYYGIDVSGETGLMIGAIVTTVVTTAFGYFTRDSIVVSVGSNEVPDQAIVAEKEPSKPFV